MRSAVHTLSDTLCESIEQDEVETFLTLINDVSVPRGMCPCSGHTILTYAAEFGARRIVAALLTRGLAAVNGTDYSGSTAYQIAKIHNDTELMRLLREHGADVNAQNHFDRAEKERACTRAG